MTPPLAHAGHVLIELPIYLGPVLLLVAWFKLSEFVAHTALVYGVSGSGKLITIYPANFKPDYDIAHDVPKLAAS